MNAVVAIFCSSAGINVNVCDKYNLSFILMYIQYIIYQY